MSERLRIRAKSADGIAAAVEAAIHAGRMTAGEPLPTVRELAATLNVSPATVAAGYKLLSARGLVAGSGRRGTRVTPRPPSPAARRAEPLAAGLVDLATGNPDPELLPPLEPALRSLARAPRLYGEPAELRPLIGFLNAEFEADGIATVATTVVGGALDAIDRVLREHLRAGDVVAVEDPSFPGVRDLLAASGFRCTPIAVDDDGPQPAAMDEALRRAKAAVVTPRAQNPTGAAVSAGRASELRRLLRRHRDLLLIENDPGGPVAGAPFETMTAGMTRWAVIRSTSKFLGPDLRLAAVAGDELTIARVEGRHALGARWVSTILQQLALALWSDPSSGRLLARAAETYAHRRTALLAALAAHGIEAHGRSGFNVWIPVRLEGPVVAALADAGWGVMAGERFRLRAAPGLRVTAATLPPPDAARFAADLAAILPSAAARFA